MSTFAELWIDYIAPTKDIELDYIGYSNCDATTTAKKLRVTATEMQVVNCQNVRACNKSGSKVAIWKANAQVCIEDDDKSKEKILHVHLDLKNYRDVPKPPAKPNPVCQEEGHSWIHDSFVDEDDCERCGASWPPSPSQSAGKREEVKVNQAQRREAVAVREEVDGLDRQIRDLQAEVKASLPQWSLPLPPHSVSLWPIYILAFGVGFFLPRLTLT